jgi:hypothetical protein
MNLGPKITMGVGVGLCILGIILIDHPMSGVLGGFGFVYIALGLLNWKF